ncbi:hypothetical protein NF27_JF00320 [Candidatus Jidaibacter acanthamoeba]|uniref:Glucose-6-phosphate isomerase n=1 Tax=Candidatus Jidaibacter acanthamoebae TaxID=86105 RepID=A0A0C1QF35_9RICK|nr:hypothetical protein [Candidatus Jidaibacter acanthamoeba]KIE04154.1 hypothetical protein NF27_JF00320 [Candidatus Jidaibacter acanthamoeba]
MNIKLSSNMECFQRGEEFLKVLHYIKDNSAPDYKLFSFNSSYYYNLTNLLEPIARQIKEDCRTVVMVGMGGAILNPKTFALFNRNADLNIEYLDTLDPIYFQSFIKRIELKQTKFLIISKSGETLETISLCLTLIKIFEQQGIKNINKHFIFITGFKDSTLKEIAINLGSTILPHEEIGGRFASFTNINLLPLMLMNQDAHAFCEGGEEVLRDFLYNREESLIAKGMPFLTNMVENKYSIHINMSYAKSLHNFLEWNKQIIAESLGKEGFGITPMCAHGPEDQHSQLQLYLDGSKDKFFSLYNFAIYKAPNLPAVEFQGIFNKTIEDLILAQYKAFVDILSEHKIPTRQITMLDDSAKSLGALMMFSMIETIVLGLMNNINPFGQPAVEGMKQLVYKLLK